MTKEKLWKLIEAYRMSGGREEHWRNRDALDIALTDMFDVQEPVGYVYWAKGHAEGAIDVQTLKPGTALYASPNSGATVRDQE